MTKSGITLMITGISLAVIGTVVSPSLHQPIVAIGNDNSGWRVVDRLIAVSGGILFLAGIIMTALGIRTTRRQRGDSAPAAGSGESYRSLVDPASLAPSPARAGQANGYDILFITIAIIGATILALGGVAMFFFRQV